MSPRNRPFAIALAVVVTAWGLAFAGFSLARHLKPTPDKVRAFLHSVDFSKLTGTRRAEALRKLAEMLDALTLEERREARSDGEMARWFAAMTDAEKTAFMEATMPSGFQQMFAAFEQMPADKRRKAVDDSVKRMREQREKAALAGPVETASDASDKPAELPPELREKAVQIGLKTFYDTGSAQMKAELAPMLEEMQRSMESGQLFREMRQRRPGP